VHVRLPDGRQRNYPAGTTTAQIAADPALRQALGLPTTRQQVARQMNAAVDPYGTLNSLSRGEPQGNLLQLAPGHNVRVVRQGLETAVYAQDGQRMLFKAGRGGTGPSDNELIASSKVRQAVGLPPMPAAQKAKLLAAERNPLASLAPVIGQHPVVKPGEAQPSSPLTLKEGRVVKQVQVQHAGGKLVLTRPDGKTLSLDNVPTAALPLLPEVRKFAGLPAQPAIGSEALARKAAKDSGMDFGKVLGQTAVYATMGAFFSYKNLRAAGMTHQQAVLALPAGVFRDFFNRFINLSPTEVKDLKLQFAMKAGTGAVVWAVSNSGL
jgi:hypothetical protein